ncbi:bifunctional folylpolyglutamate synthase/dihydrofolate synthase [Tritrichomonas foetus]|uniref:Bifunctional folylpolyglutamate synthase/dihydrofolate synthase n=1 Tax=Tritrichomonas foetus TaxID=1144522 RepID=A0A1J4L3C5_9EUKA|nr:bifunctional folylpolyglutamate synthase/dihydrofolate synthase [Tritrichomonas foetus]|eukprot:OHT16413.1 bifunctional folylpolyglutamate synthase/dihydrofolate synthase [Tritrichomonas foetus]
MEFTSIDQIMTYLNSQRFSYNKEYTLKNVILLFNHLKINESTTPIIHVTGTNGKGSTCAMLESIYRNNGLKTGLFSSPYFISNFEQIKVNFEDISESDYVCLFNDVFKVAREIENHDQKYQFSVFEYDVAIAMLYFMQQQTDINIIEVGLGGRLDATNALMHTNVSVFTTISLDHQAILGDTRQKIVEEKVGIIKENSTVVVGNGIKNDILEIIENHAHAKNSKLISVPEIKTILDNSFPDYQQYNASTAYYTAQILNTQLSPRFQISDEQIIAGIKMTFWSGRWQIIDNFFGKKLIIDGAHNEEGVKAIVSLICNLKNQPIIILGSNTKYRAKCLCKTLAPLAKRLVLTSSKNSMSLLKDDLFTCIPTQDSEKFSYEELDKVFEILEKSTDDILITGSLYLIGDVFQKYPHLMKK